MTNYMLSRLWQSVGYLDWKKLCYYVIFYSEPDGHGRYEIKFEILL